MTTEHDAMVQEVEVLRGQLAEAKKDTARVDALAEVLRAYRVAHIGRQYVGGRSDEAVAGSRYSVTVHGREDFTASSSEHESVRDLLDCIVATCIDAAMSSSSPSTAGSPEGSDRNG